MPDSNGGRRYKQRVRYALRPREEWIAVPVPDSGVPREIVDAARQAIKHNRAPSNAGRQFWELSGGFVRCGLCGHIMDSHTTANPGRPVYFYYACRTRYKKGVEACSNGNYLLAARVEALVWEGVTKLLKDPEQLRADLDALLASLMDIAPIALDSLTPEERNGFYKMLDLKVIAHPGGQLEVEFGDGLSIRERETASGRCSGRGG